MLFVGISTPLSISIMAIPPDKAMPFISSKQSSEMGDFTNLIAVTAKMSITITFSMVYVDFDLTYPIPITTTTAQFLLTAT